MRHLRFAVPDADEPNRLALIESDSTEVITYDSFRSFRRIEHHGRMFRLAGRDRVTGEMVYLPEVAS